MRGSHLTSRVDARSAGGGAELIEDVLAQALLRIVAKAREEFFEALVGRQSRNEIVNDQGDRVVSTQARVERLLVLDHRHRAGRGTVL